MLGVKLHPIHDKTYRAIKRIKDAENGGLFHPVFNSGRIPVRRQNVTQMIPLVVEDDSDGDE